MHTFTRTALLALALLAITSYPALAARVQQAPPTPGGGYSLTAAAGLISVTGPDPRSYGTVFGVKIGYEQYGTSFRDSLGVEGSLNVFNSGSSTGYLYNVDFLYHIPTGKKAIPFLVLGLGGIETGSSTSATTSPFINYGIGLKYFFKDNLALRGDARHILAYDSRHGNVHSDLDLTVGISYYFGRKSVKTPAETSTQKQTETEQREKDLREKEQQEQELKEKLQEEETQKQLELEEKKREAEQLEWKKQEKVRLHKEWEEFQQQQKGSGAPGGKPSASEPVAPVPVPAK